MTTCNSFFGGLVAAIIACSVAAAQTGEFGGTRYPELLEITTQEGQTTHFVVGQTGWGEVLAEIGRIRGESEVRDREIAEQLYRARNDIPPGFLFEAARRYTSFDPDQAVYVFLLARARTVYDAQRCVDSTATEGVPVISDMAGSEVAQLMNITTDGQTVARTERMQGALERLLNSDDIFNSNASPWWICSASDTAYFAAVNSAAMPEGEWLKSSSVWPAIQQNVVRNIRENQALLAITMGTRELANQE